MRSHCNPAWKAGAIAFVALICGLVRANTNYVEFCRLPATGPRDGSAANPYDSVGNAVQQVSTGGRILIEGGGLFPETGGVPLVIDRSVYITAQNGTAVVGQPAATQKICQLTGQMDKERNQYIGTETDYGLAGVDLGASVEHNGRVYFLFGDTAPSGPLNPPWRDTATDSVVWVPANSDPEQGLHLNFLTAPDGKYLSPRIKLTSQSSCAGASEVDVSTFDVPGGGFSDGASIYVFYTTCWNGSFDAPLMGKSLLVRLDDKANNCFTWIYTLSCLPNAACYDDGIPVCGKFINVAPVVVTNSDFPGLPPSTGRGVLLFGSGRYRKSEVYLAYLPLEGLENRQNLLYWGTDGVGGTNWVTSELSAIPLFVSPEPGVGEFSVSWNSFLMKWIMVYNQRTPMPDGPNLIYYRLGDHPWGPWHAPAVLFDPACDRGFGHFMHYSNPISCDTVGDGLQGDPNRVGDVYGPYLISHFTRANITTTTIYWTMSTWNPYQVMLMKSRLRPDGSLDQLGSRYPALSQFPRTDSHPSNL